MENISFSLPEIIAGFLTLLGLFTTAYGLYMKSQERKKTGQKESTQNAVKWVEIDTGLQTLKMQQVNILSTIGEYKMKLDAIMDLIQTSKYEVKDIKHQFDLLKHEFDMKIETIQKEQANILARLNKASL